MSERNWRSERRPLLWLLGCLIALAAVLAVPAGRAEASQWTARHLPPKPLEGGETDPQQRHRLLLTKNQV